MHSLFGADNKYPRLPDGRILCNRYTIQKTIKSGRVFQLVEAKDTIDGDIKVVKIIVKAKVQKEIIIQEIEWLKEHLSNLPLWRQNPFYEESRDLSYYFLAFRRSPHTLRDALSDTSLHISRRHAIEIALQMAQGLCALHEGYIVHREFSPESVELLDWKCVDESFYDTTSKTFKSKKVLLSTKLAVSFYGYTGIADTVKQGLDQYRSPEVTYGLGVTTSSDVFSLGCVIAEVLTRRALFPPCTDGPLYIRDKTALYNELLGPIPEFLIREIRGAATGRYQYPMLTFSLFSRISRTVSQFCEDAPPLEHMFTNEIDREVIYSTVDLDYDRRIPICYLIEFPFFLEINN